MHIEHMNSCVHGSGITEAIKLGPAELCPAELFEEQKKNESLFVNLSKVLNRAKIFLKPLHFIIDKPSFYESRIHKFVTTFHQA